jgi:hypothetical protein
MVAAWACSHDLLGVRPLRSALSANGAEKPDAHRPSDHRRSPARCQHGVSHPAGAVDAAYSPAWCGPPIYRHRQPVRYWSSIIVMSAFFGLGVVLVLWGLLSPE